MAEFLYGEWKAFLIQFSLFAFLHLTINALLVINQKTSCVLSFLLFATKLTTICTFKQFASLQHLWGHTPGAFQSYLNLMMRECPIFLIQFCRYLYKFPTSGNQICYIIVKYFFHFSCHDASLAIKSVFDKFQSVVIASGMLSPIDPYPRLINFNPVVSRSFTMSLTRDSICPMVLTRWR